MESPQTSRFYSDILKLAANLNFTPRCAVEAVTGTEVNHTQLIKIKKRVVYVSVEQQCVAHPAVREVLRPFRHLGRIRIPVEPT